MQLDSGPPQGKGRGGKSPFKSLGDFWRFFLVKFSDKNLERISKIREEDRTSGEERDFRRGEGLQDRIG